MNSKLPIYLVPGTLPRRFRWKNLTDTINGVRVQDCEGPVQPSIEGALTDLVALAKRQVTELKSLRAEVLSLKERLAAAVKQPVPTAPKGK
jgi:hypothetical protein